MRKERETISGFIYKTRKIHSSFHKDCVPDFSEEHHEELNNPDYNGYYFVSEGIVLHIDSNENIKKLDPILSNKIVKSSLKHEHEGERKIELLFIPNYKSTYFLKEVNKEEVSDISSLETLFCNSIFGGRPFTCSDVTKYNYENHKGTSLDKIILNQVFSSGTKEGSSVIEMEELLELAKNRELYKAREIEKINREGFR